MEPAAALATLQIAIETGRTQVAVMDLDWKKFDGAIGARVDASFFSGMQSLQRREREARPTDNVSPANLVEELQTAPESERRFLLSAHIKMCARKVLGLKETATIQDSIALQDVGLDSLMALEMRNELSQSLGLALPAGLLFDHPSVDDLTAHLLGALAPIEDAAAPAKAQEDAGSTSADLQTLSDEEAERLLIQELDRAEREKANA
jgi:acyl carrier protein